MVSKQSVEQQLKRLHFNLHAWGKAEVEELPNILLDDEKIFECVNGIYDSGFALLVATNIRLLLVDKKPLNYLTVEDLRFDMINEIDYSHRLIGAYITVSTGNKTLRFRSYNQQRLRKLINHVQHRMAETKQEQSLHQEDQKQHLQQINQQLQAYLLAQYQQQQELQEQLRIAREKHKVPIKETEPVKPSPELSDYLLAQSLLQTQGEKLEKQISEPEPANDEPRHATQNSSASSKESVAELPARAGQVEQPKTVPAAPFTEQQTTQTADLYQEGMHEIFGRRSHRSPTASAASVKSSATPHPYNNHNALEISPLKIAYAKLPLALRNRKFGRPSFHAHSQSFTGTPAKNYS